MNRLSTTLFATLLATGVTLPMAAQEQQWGHDDMFSHRERQRSQLQDRDYGFEQRQDRDQQYDRRSQQRYGQQSRQSYGQQGQRYAGQQSQQRQVQLQGRVQSFRTTTLRGEQQPHVLVRVQQRGGQTAIVDLGQVGDLQAQRARLDRGDQIQVTGHTGRINGRPVIVATDANLQGRRTGTSFGREMSQQQQQQRRASQASSRQQGWQGWQQKVEQGRFLDSQKPMGFVQGRLVDMRDVSLQGVPDQHRLVKVQTSGGQIAIADLGTRDSFDQLDLQRGDNVMVYGNPVTVNDRPVLLATHIAELKGDIIRIDSQYRARPSALTGQRSGQQNQYDRSSRDSQNRRD